MAKQSGFGAIEKLPSGRFRARYQHPNKKYTETGQRNWIKAPTTFENRARAQKWLSSEEAAISEHRWRDPLEVAREREEAEQQAKRDALTFGEYGTAWIEGRELRVSTRRTYLGFMRNRLEPRWGDTPIKDIATSDVRAWIAKTAKDAHPKARLEAFQLFRAILNTAEEDGVISRSPCVRGMMKGVEPKKQPALTYQQLWALADEVPDYMRLLVLLSGLTGLRQGEARELRGKDVISGDGQRVWLSITRAVAGQGKHKQTGKPKTSTSIGTVPVPSEIAGEILEAALQAGKEGLLFPRLGHPKDHIPQTTYNGAVKDAGKRLGLDISTHVLRITHATQLAEAGAGVKDIQTALRQSTASMAIRYTRSSDDRQEMFAEKVGEQFAKQRGVKVADLDVHRTKRA